MDFLGRPYDPIVFLTSLLLIYEIHVLVRNWILVPWNSEVVKYLPNAYVCACASICLLLVGNSGPRFKMPTKFKIMQNTVSEASSIIEVALEVHRMTIPIKQHKYFYDYIILFFF